MTPYQFGQHIKLAVDMTSPEYAARMKAFTGQMRSQGIKNITYAPDGQTILSINKPKPAAVQQPQTRPLPVQAKNPAVQPTPQPVRGPATAPAKPMARPQAPAGNVIQRKSRSAF